MADHAREGDPAAEWVPIDALSPWETNPRRNNIAARKVADAIKRFGWGAPIVARRADGEVIAGHTRLKAAQILGLSMVPVRYVDVGTTDAHLMALADNKLGEEAEWDQPALAEVLSDFGLEQVELAGWDSYELGKLADAVPNFGPLESERTEADLRHDEQKREWQRRNEEKRKAHVAVGNAIRDGKLTRQPCEHCGAEPAEAHHPDYSKPLEVVWLCKPCHEAEHHRVISCPECGHEWKPAPSV